MNALRKIDQKEIDKMLDDHFIWRKGDPYGKQLVLCDADLSDLNLKSRDFGNSIIRRCDFSRSNISFSVFDGSFIEYAMFDHVIAINTSFSSSRIHSSSFINSDLGLSRFDDACLGWCTFGGSDLRRVKFGGIKIVDVVTLDNANNVPFIPMACPEEGSFIGWKKAGKQIVKLFIPEDALRSSATTRKCRCNKAKVLEIQEIDGTKSVLSSIGSNYDSDFVYTVGEMVSVENFDTDRFHECAPGIHFFINRQEAVEYIY